MPEGAKHSRVITLQQIPETHLMSSILKKKSKIRARFTLTFKSAKDVPVTPNPVTINWRRGNKKGEISRYFFRFISSTLIPQHAFWK